MREAVAAKHVGPLSATRAQELVATAWEQETATGMGAFAEASAMVAKFVANEGPVDAMRVLAVEQAFTVTVGDYTLTGIMDRVDRIDHETIEIVDYKTGELVPTAEELRDNLQLSLYQHGAQSLWPWAKRVKLTLHMVRHGIKLRTTRTSADIAQALAYVKATGGRIRVAQTTGTFKARMSSSCGMCQYRLSCPAYAELVANAPKPRVTIPDSIDALAQEREHMATTAQVAGARKHELDTALKGILEHSPEVKAGGRRYFIRTTTRRTFPLPETIGKVAEVSGMAAGEVVERLACINNKDLETLLKELNERVPRHKVNLLRAELEAAAERTYVPQLWSKPEVVSRNRRGAVMSAKETNEMGKYSVDKGKRFERELVQMFSTAVPLARVCSGLSMAQLARKCLTLTSRASGSKPRWVPRPTPARRFDRQRQTPSLVGGPWLCARTTAKHPSSQWRCQTF